MTALVWSAGLAGGGLVWDAGLPGSSPVSFSGTVPAQTATVGVFFTLDLSGYFSGTLTPIAYSTFAGTLVGSGLAIDPATAIVSGTPLAAGVLTFAALATDSALNAAHSNTFTITVAAAPAVPAIATGPWRNNAGTLLPSATIPKIGVFKVSDLSTVLLLSNRTTDASALMSIADALLVSGTKYLVLACDAAGNTYGVEARTAA